MRCIKLLYIIWFITWLFVISLYSLYWSDAYPELKLSFKLFIFGIIVGSFWLGLKSKVSYEIGLIQQNARLDLLLILFSIIVMLFIISNLTIFDREKEMWFWQTILKENFPTTPLPFVSPSCPPLFSYILKKNKLYSNFTPRKY